MKRVTQRGLPIGADHHKARLTEQQVDEVFALREQGLSQQAIGDRFGVARETVRDVLSGRSWNKAAATETPWRSTDAPQVVLVWAPLLCAWSTPPT